MVAEPAASRYYRHDAIPPAGGCESRRGLSHACIGARRSRAGTVRLVPSHGSRLCRCGGIAVLVAVIAGCGGSGSTPTPARHPARHTMQPAASESPATSPTPSGRHIGTRGSYLALGDSVPFGFRMPTALPTPTYAVASSFVGYPDLVATHLKLTLVNASCPGETTASFQNTSAPSNGCENLPVGGLGYRSVFPLHVSYSGPQLAFATSYLRSHPSTRLVSLMLGANDPLRCEAATRDHCASEMPSVIRRITANIVHILGALRDTGYRGPLVLVDYYSTNYASAGGDAASQAVNRAERTAATGFHVTIADSYAAFRRAAGRTGGDSCLAGLLARTTSGGCDIHPSRAGQSLLAAVVERAAVG